MHSDNPAARLLAILEVGKTKSSEMICKDVWHNLLDVEKNNQALLMSRLGKLMELPEQIISSIKLNYPNQSSSYSHWSNKVNIAFMQQNLNGHWGEFINLIDNHTIVYLQMSADLLDMKSATKVMDNSDLSTIRLKVDELLTETIEADVDLEFKKYITNYLRKIIIAIDEYHISGAIPIAETIESALGHAFLDENYRKNISNSNVGRKLIDVLTSVASVVTVAVGLPQLPEAYRLLLDKI